MAIPATVTNLLNNKAFDIQLYDFRNVKHNNRLYTICNTNGNYYAIFTAHINYPSRTPVLFTYEVSL